MKPLTHYNRLMNELGLEHLTIGERLSENTENWNLRDMVSECQYQLDCHYKHGNTNSDGMSVDHYIDLYGGSVEDAKEIHLGWKREVRLLRGFIRKYENEAMAMRCETGHCSKFD